MTFVIPYPMIDPVLLQFGPVAIRWYSLAYIAGLLLAWRYMRALAKHPPQPASAVDLDDFLVWATLGVILGGRLGYVIFYKPEFYLDNPLAILQVWRGGMSFHGGLLGVLVAGILFARRRSIAYLPFADLLACAAPIGLFLGRLANFINAELIGRVTDVPWAMVFPGGGEVPRHPSQLYEAALEGLGLFVLLYVLWRMEGVRRRAGLLTGVFLSGYALARSLAELFRQPDVHIGFLLGGTTMGQWLSAPMLAIGVYLIVRAKPEE
ncbi:MAG: prolipoprotein diacylglyceryl transferase [Proteobacteria bacterium]|nr:prolipoprotein diacylglyceryl transferase [Pseudomonadota bacterium]